MVSFAVRATNQSSSHELSEHVAQNATIHEVGHFWVRVQAALHLEGGAVRGTHSDGLADGHLLAQIEREGLLAGQTERLGRGSILVLQGQDAHAEQVRPVDSLVAFGDDGAHSLQVGALGGPVTRGAGSVLLASEDDRGDALALVLGGGLEDWHLFVAGHVTRRRASLWHKLIDKADVSKGAPCHDLIISAPGSI